MRLRDLSPGARFRFDDVAHIPKDLCQGLTLESNGRDDNGRFVYNLVRDDNQRDAVDAQWSDMTVTVLEKG